MGAQALVAAIVLLLAPSASAVRKCGQKDLNLAAGADSIPSDCTSLRLGFNSIGEAGAVAIAEALKTNTAVTSLYLDGNSIGDAGAVAIAEALKTNTAVTYLDLYANSVGDAGAAAIAEALKTNTAVTSLNLGGNNIGDVGAVAVAEALKTNTAVTSLTLHGNSIGAEIDRSIQIGTYKNAKIMDRNAKITELEAERASAGLSRYLTITNDDFINLAEVAAFDASGNQLTPVHASMNNEYGHDHGANKCIDGIAGRDPWYFGWSGFGWSGNNMCHSQPSDASGLQWLRLDFGSLVRVASVVVTNRVDGFHGRIDGAQIQLSVAETSGVVWSDTFSGAAPEYTFVHPAAAAAAATGTGRRAREESPDLG